ncbi:MAG: NAD(P)H-dependent oxidoreductase [Myxococcota bacterium]|nr:NAD(P)H-dependent oxidoreductase [Myxococcota bacterium]
MLLICTASHGKNKDLADTIRSHASAAGVDCALCDLTEYSIPLYTSRSDDTDADVDALEALFKSAKAFFVLAPEYNGSIPPSLTNAIAWLSTRSSDFRALFNGKPLAIGTHSGGQGQKVLIAMRIQFAHLGCHVMGRELLTSSSRPVNPASIDAILSEIRTLGRLE